MRRSFSAIAVSMSMLMLLAPAALGQDHVFEETPKKQYLYVLSGTYGSVEGDSLTLEGVPSALYFSDRPARIAGHRTLEALVERWEERGVLTDDPPNATLSVLDVEGPDNVVVELASIEAIDDTTVRLGFSVIEGTMPEGDFGPASLFVDPVDCEGDYT
jgi:hypothetical protein